jgi:hypothetical protein
MNIEIKEGAFVHLYVIEICLKSLYFYHWVDCKWGMG